MSVFFIVLLEGVASLGMIAACDSGEKALDKVTGNRVVNQYHKSKQAIGKLAEQEVEKYKSVPDNAKEEENKE